MPLPHPQSPPYCTPDDLVLYGANPFALNKISNDAKLQACQGATDLLDGYFSSRYPLPFVTVNDTAIKLRAAHIATWFALTGRGRNPEAGYDDEVNQRYEQAISWARDVQRQAIDLNVVVLQPNPPQYELPTVFTSPRRGWTGPRRR